MSEPRHLNSGLRVRLHLRRRGGAHRAPETEHVHEHVSDEALEICVPALEQRHDVADLSGDIQALLGEGDDSSPAPARRRLRGR